MKKFIVKNPSTNTYNPKIVKVGKTDLLFEGSVHELPEEIQNKFIEKGFQLKGIRKFKNGLSIASKFIKDKNGVSQFEGEYIMTTEGEYWNNERYESIGQIDSGFVAVKKHTRNELPETFISIYGDEYIDIITFNNVLDQLTGSKKRYIINYDTLGYKIKYFSNMPKSELDTILNLESLTLIDSPTIIIDRLSQYEISKEQLLNYQIAYFESINEKYKNITGKEYSKKEIIESLHHLLLAK